MTRPSFQLVILNLPENHTGLLNYKDTKLSGRLKDWTFLARRVRERKRGGRERERERESESESELTLKSSIGTSDKLLFVSDCRP